MERIETEVAVIGAGPGGYPARVRPRRQGEEGHAHRSRAQTQEGSASTGDAYLQRPFFTAAKVAEEARDAADFGLSYAEPEIDPGKLFSWKDEVVLQAHRRAPHACEGQKDRFTCGEGRLLPLQAPSAS